MLDNETKSTLDDIASAIDEKIHKAIDDREIQAKKSSFDLFTTAPAFTTKTSNLSDLFLKTKLGFS